MITLIFLWWLDRRGKDRDNSVLDTTMAIDTLALFVTVYFIFTNADKL